ncbi:hypothetical protein H6F89_29520 [Cyanobacteria bacterium FACHB-63]|nr:hypothetical protein [Cyanobacteria bacterium FACHB-63]
MTWRTPLGVRVLEEVEAKFFLASVQQAIDYLQEMHTIGAEVEVETGDRIFDNASFNQKAVLLHACLSALLNSDVEAPTLTNVLEAAAYFPFAFVRMRIEEEIELAKEGWFEEDEEDLQYFYRSLTWEPFVKYVLPKWQAAIEEYGEDPEESAFNERSDNFDLWDNAIEGLLERVFWDRDWQMSSIQPQLLDGVDEQLSAVTGLDDEYMTNRLPQVREEEALAALKAIRHWTQAHSSE